MKSVAGRLAYLVGGAQAALEYAPVGFRFHFAGFPPLSLPVQVMIVANGPTIGGGYALSPHARIDDGHLDLLVIQETSLPALAALMARCAGGELLEGEEAVFRARFTDLQFRADRETTLNTDGAPLRLEHGRYTVRPRAARFLC